MWLKANGVPSSIKMGGLADDKEEVGDLFFRSILKLDSDDKMERSFASRRESCSKALLKSASA